MAVVETDKSTLVKCFDVLESLTEMETGSPQVQKIIEVENLTVADVELEVATLARVAQGGMIVVAQGGATQVDLGASIATATEATNVD
ncbi:OLC1v1019002C1 [Oldenlandia corymbosa var. corymbosa]|uniref:OLC1v1019002C1 n=1 Tax=Oldenlandia corymbosa var. corymbosa TaxID=529605 RepID=A0AAV1ECY4_OLDCO|nr:OLC1v1019002C1 [Oldenlandia corymbosa var. corymbosa]